MGIDTKREHGQAWTDKNISALTLRRDGIGVNLQVAIINLISQIPMSIWLYNDGQIVVASTSPLKGKK